MTMVVLRHSVKKLLAGETHKHAKSGIVPNYIVTSIPRTNARAHPDSQEKSER